MSSSFYLLRLTLLFSLFFLTISPIKAAPAAPRPLNTPSRIISVGNSHSTLSQSQSAQATPTSLPQIPFHIQLQSIFEQHESLNPDKHHETPNDLYEFYRPWQIKAKAIPQSEKPERILKYQNVYFDSPPTDSHSDSHSDSVNSRGATPVDKRKRDDIPTVPTSYLAEPTFPAEFPSCPKCEEKYDSISSCAKASAVFQNSTSIFNDPLSYIAVIKCACTDTFQAVYPQCVDCFQHTNQCWFLGTDPQGTGAPSIITNIRQICGFGSALLGGVASANSANNTNYIPTDPGTYYDVTQTGPGYQDQSTGAIDLFGSPAAPSFELKKNQLLVFFTLSSVLVAGLQTIL